MSDILSSHDTLTADDLTDLISQFIVVKQYGSLQYLLDTLLRKVTKQNAAHKRVASLIHSTRKLINSPVVTSAPEILKLLYPFYLELLTRKFRYRGKDDETVDPLVQDLLTTTTRHLNSGNATLIDKAAQIVASLPSLLDTCVDLGDVGRFGLWLDDYTIPFFWVVREGHYDEFQQAAAQLIEIFDKLSITPELLQKIEPSLEQFYTRFAGRQRSDKLIQA